MKRIFAPFLSLLMASFILSGCHSDDETPSIANGKYTFTQGNGLTLLYNGNEEPGKTVDVTVEGNHATFTMGSIFDMSKIPGADITGDAPGPGVLPGSPEVTITTDISPSGDGYVFSGNGSTEYVEYEYSGRLTDKSLEFYFSDAKLKTTPIPEVVWAPRPLVKDDNGLGYKTTPLHIEWSCAPIEGLSVNLDEILKLFAMAPIIPVYGGTAYMSIAEAISQVVKTVGFNPDGNLFFTYIATANGAAEITQNQPNGVQYVSAGSNLLKLYVNPLSLYGIMLTNLPAGSNDPNISFRDIENPSSGEKLQALLLKEMLPMLSEGVPLEYTLGQDTLDLFVNTEMAVKLLSDIVVPLLQDESFVADVMQAMEADESLKPYVAQIQQALPLIPAILEKTTKFELGLSFVESTSN